MGTAEAGLTEPRPRHVAYVVSRYPKVTETFVLFEALALVDLGVRVSLYPLVAARSEDTGGAAHAEAESFEASVVRIPAFSGPVLRSLLATAVTRPVRFVRALVAAVRGSGASRAHLARAVAIFPKTVHMARRLEADGVDHVHAHFANHPALAALIAHELTRIPFSFTAHGSDLHRDPRGLTAKVRAACRTITVSEYNRAFIEDRVGEELGHRVEVLHCGADLARFGATDRTAAERRGAAVETDCAPPLRVACVAALRRVKGHTHLLRAVRRLVDRGVAVECRLAGHGPLDAELRAEASALGLDGHVRFLGARSREDVAALLEWADVLALTSVVDGEGRREGIPVSLMEGMAAGLPVVASRQSGIPELVEDGVTGWLAEPGDDGSIADALERVAGDAERAREMGAAGRRRVSRDFDLRTNARRLADSILELEPRQVGLA